MSCAWPLQTSTRKGTGTTEGFKLVNKGLLVQLARDCGLKIRIILNILDGIYAEFGYLFEDSHVFV